jgi:predicted Ser/Thr protein kinase
MSNYQQLTKKELRDYIKQHPEDEDAFQYYLTIMRAKPGVVVSTEEQALAEFRKRLESESTH